MSDDKNNSDSFDLENFDFDSLNSDSPKEAGQETEGDSFDINNPFGDDLAPFEPGVSADNPYLQPSASHVDDGSVADTIEGDDYDSPVSGAVEEDSAETEKPQKKGLFGGFGKSKGKEKGKKTSRDNDESGKEKPRKKEKTVKEKSGKELIPQDLPSILCLAFSAFLLVSLLLFNIAAFLTRGDSIMQTLCFLGAFNLVALTAAAVPVLFFKYPGARTLPNIMLGISVVAMFASVLVCVTAFAQYSFVMTP